ncbi:MAG: Poly(3-hydroxyalkanoate) depolymerase [uncultured Nocardioidaceae bacterium]|uniref:Poly(3-hydroxyalkanoate) depolymerase n=1 Tax=uncultured Nocardioidaceae bacterium TaxID=253824 RepID=A0A6J4LF32_9ACTN|nr:MAG: Poly(3-hydroxyalkanoate) depolymerase [uncultured Nocardioidaceae bacterium]
MLSVRGVEIRVSVRPARGRLAATPPLLLCNGIGASFEVLQPLVDRLDPDRGVIRFDVPGVGGSPLPPRPYLLATLAPRVADLAAQLGHGRFDVLGLSWGGGLAQQLSVQRRSNVRRLVLVATGTGTLMVPAHPRVLSKMVTPRRHRDPAYAREVAGLIYGGTMRTDPECGAELLHAATRAGPRRGYYYQLAAATGWCSLPFLRMISQPTLLLAGDDDPIVPLVNAKVMARLIRGAQLHVYPGGHLGVLTEAKALAPVIDHFLDLPDMRHTPGPRPRGWSRPTTTSHGVTWI